MSTPAHNLNRDLQKHVRELREAMKAQALAGGPRPTLGAAFQQQIREAQEMLAKMPEQRTLAQAASLLDKLPKERTLPSVPPIEPSVDLSGLDRIKEENARRQAAAVDRELRIRDAVEDLLVVMKGYVEEQAGREERMILYTRIGAFAAVAAAVFAAISVL